MVKGFTSQRGLTLLEILIALVVLSVGLLGVAGMQATGMRNNHSAYTKTQATALAMDMTDRIRANATAADSYVSFDTAGTIPANPGCISDAAGCTAAQLVAYDKYIWSQPLISSDAPVLPGGRGLITKTGDVFTVILVWTESNFKGVERTACVTGQTDEQACLKMSFQL